jgi:hypothetical protein
VSAPKWAVGMRRIAPGIYVSLDGKTVEVDAAEMCESHGLPCTPENQDIVEEALRRAMPDFFSGARLEVIEKDER